MRLVAAWLAAVAMVACASPPELGAPGTGAVWGYVRLVPREGAPAGAAGGAYGDRRVAHAKRIDYSRPGFVVVFVEGPEPVPEELALAIGPSPPGRETVARDAAVGLGSRIRVANGSERPRTVSCPAAGLLQQLEPGDALSFTPSEPGLFEVFLLDEGTTLARVFVSPGPFSVVTAAGRYGLVGMPPGAHRLRAWHPRFPPASAEIVLVADQATRVDLEIGVGSGQPAGAAPSRPADEPAQKAPPAAHAH